MARLGDICTVVSGSTPKTSHPEYWDGTYNWITPAELNDDTKVIYESQRKITQEAIKATGLSPFPAGTVILSSRAPIGKVAIAGTEMYCNQGFKNLICSDAIDSCYLYWFLKCNTDYLNSLGRGATFKEISKKIVEDIEIPLPSLSEQKRIATLFDKVNSLLELQKQQLLKLGVLIKARFIEMFGDPESNNRGWPIQPLETLCAVGSSKRVYQNELSNEGVPFWRVSDLVSKMDTGDAESGLYIPEEKYGELKLAGLVPTTNDILVTSRGTLGRCYIVKDEDRFYFQDGMISWLSDYSNKITPLYLQNLFAMPGFRKQIDSLQAGSTVAYLSIAMLKKLKIMIPSIDAQNDYIVFNAQIEKSKATIQKASDVTQLLFESLMKKYFG